MLSLSHTLVCMSANRFTRRQETVVNLRAGISSWAYLHVHVHVLYSREPRGLNREPRGNGDGKCGCMDAWMHGCMEHDWMHDGMMACCICHVAIAMP
jgi:hypothetical protein